MLTPEQRNELARLERALAYSAARSDVECICWSPDGTSPLDCSRWYDPTSADADASETVATAIRYLDLRGLIERSPQGWVRVREEA